MRRAFEHLRSVEIAALAATLLAAAPPAMASPQPSAIAWSTYLRTGPGETYTAIAELEHDTPVKLIGCNGRWCRVTGSDLDGYVDRDALYLPRTLPLNPPAQSNCIVAGLAGNRRPIATRFCSAQPSGR